MTQQQPQGSWNDQPPNDTTGRLHNPSYPMATVPAAAPVAGSWWRRLPLLAKTALIAGGALMLCCGGLVTVTAIAGPPTPSPTTPAVGPAPFSTPTVEAAAAPPAPSTPAAAPSTAIAPAAQPAPAAPPAIPLVEKRIITETRSIAFATKIVNDPDLAKGTTTVTTRGVPGVKTLTYEVTLTNGVQTAKKLVRTAVTTAPVTRVVAVGTKTTQTCDPNYSGACVPIASDVDCAGGSGNGPAYVEGPVTVIGTDVYGLDRDGDGIGCDT